MINYEIINPNVNKITLNEIIMSNSYNKDLVYNSSNWAKYLQNYLILTHVNFNLNKLSIYMSRYYWFKKFYYNYSISNGIDAGIEQQIVQLLESINNEFPDFDWYEIQRINQKIEDESGNVSDVALGI